MEKTVCRAVRLAFGKDNEFTEYLVYSGIEGEESGKLFCPPVESECDSFRLRSLVRVQAIAFQVDRAIRF